MSIAVVIPVYNHERFIRAAIESALGQTLPVERIVVVNDGSTDRSEQVAFEIGDPRVRVLSQPNSGAHIAQNRGVEAVRDFDYIAILNSDDLFFPERLEQCIALLEQRSDIEVVVTGVALIDDQGVPLPPDHPKARWLDAAWQARCPDYAEWLGCVNFAKTTSNIVARTGYLLAHPFQPYRYVHDYFFLAQAAIERRLEILDEPLLYYRTHATNTIKSGGRGSVQREAMDMAVTLLRRLAPLLGQSADARLATARFYRALLENNVDFRGEPFLWLLAQFAAAAPEDTLKSLLDALTVEAFPDLAAPSGRAMRQRLAAREVQRLLGVVQASRWCALGRLLGLVPPLAAVPAADPEQQLARLRKTLDGTPWLALGRRAGLFRF